MVMQLVSKHKHVKLRLFQSTILRNIFVRNKRLETICTLGKPFTKYLGDQIKAGTIVWDHWIMWDTVGFSKIFCGCWNWRPRYPD